MINKQVSQKEGNRKKVLVWTLVLAAVLFINLKSIFCDYGLDNAYALATSWRFIKGDHLLAEMNEPHMTSSFLLNLIILSFYATTKSTTGIAFFGQIAGAILYSCVGIFLYLKIRKNTSFSVQVLVMSFFLIARAKHTVFPEFSNMLIAFSVIMWILLCEYIKDESKLMYLIGAAVAMSLMVLSYLTSVIVFVGVMIALLIMTKKKVRVLYGFLLPCFILGCCYVIYLCHGRGIVALIDSVKFMMQSDSAHSSVFGNISNLWKMDRIYCLSFLYPLIIIASLLVVHKMPKETKNEYLLGICISVPTFLAVCLVTNLSINSSFSYLILGVIVAIMGLSKVLWQKKALEIILSLFVILISVHRGIVVVGYPQDTPNFVQNSENYVRVGPNKGIVTTLGNCNRCKGDYNDWSSYIRQDDAVLAVGGWYIDSSVYLINEPKVSHYSVMCNPTYDEHLLEYWKRFPDKQPTVIAVYGYNGVINQPQDSWIMKYLQEGYVEDEIGEYWTFYRLGNN